MHCFPVQCRIHIHVVRVFVSARVYYVPGLRPGKVIRRTVRGRGGKEGGGWLVDARLCPENGRTMRPYWIIPTSLARVERPVRISIKNFKLQARFRARAAPSVPVAPWRTPGRLATPADAPAVAPGITGCLWSLGCNGSAVLRFGPSDWRLRSATEKFQ